MKLIAYFLLLLIFIIVMDYCPNLLNELDIEYKLNVIDVSDLNLNILCLNTRSCRNKMDELTQLVLDLKKLYM